MHTLFPHSSAELRKVGKIQFGVLSPDEIRQTSVAKIEFHEAYEQGKPKMKGLLDPRMGTVDRQMKCATCSGSMTECPGHFGHLELAKPVFNIGFLSTVLKILRSVCFHCSKLLVDENDGRFREAQELKNVKHRFARVYTLAKTKTICEGGEDTGTDKEQGDSTDPKEKKKVKKSHGGCGNFQPKITKDGMKIMAEFKNVGDDPNVEKKQLLTAEKVHAILKLISDEDCLAMGFDPKWARPDWMIITIMPIPPPPVRPSIMMDSAARGEDDLTHKLADIIKANANLRKQEANGAAAHIISQFQELLQYHIATFIDNEIPGFPQATVRSGSRALKSLKQRLRGKEGRIRGNLMGKRVDFSLGMKEMSAADMATDVFEDREATVRRRKTVTRFTSPPGTTGAPSSRGNASTRGGSVDTARSSALHTIDSNSTTHRPSHRNRFFSRGHPAPIDEERGMADIPEVESGLATPSAGNKLDPRTGLESPNAIAGMGENERFIPHASGAMPVRRAGSGATVGGTPMRETEVVEVPRRSATDSIEMRRMH